MTETTKNHEEEEGKRSAYPYATFPKSIEIAEAIKDLGGSNGDVKRSVLAHSLGVDDNSPSLIQNIASAKAFGLIRGRGSVHLTEIAKNYFYPTRSGDQQRAILQAIRTPKIFEALIDRFDGTKIPESATLVNILHRDHEVAASWQARVATLFLSTMREAKIVDAAGILRFKSSLLTSGKDTIGGMNSAQTSSTSVSAIERTPVVPESSLAREPSRFGVAGWTYRGIRVDVPENMTMELWKKLFDYVNVLKPDDE